MFIYKGPVTIQTKIQSTQRVRNCNRVLIISNDLLCYIFSKNMNG